MRSPEDQAAARGKSVEELVGRRASTAQAEAASTVEPVQEPTTDGTSEPATETETESSEEGGGAENA